MKKHFIQSVVLSLCAVLAFTACSNDDNGGSATKDSATIQANLDASEFASWNHTIFLFKGNVLETTATNKAEIFTVEPSQTYTLKALVIEDLSNLTIPTPLNGVDDRLVVKDMSAPIPGILFGASAPTVVNQALSINVATELLTSKLQFAFTSEVKISSMTATINGLNDQITLDGVASQSSESLSKTVTLTNDANLGLFMGEAILIPTDAKELDVIYHVTLESGDTFDLPCKAVSGAGNSILKAGAVTSIEGAISKNNSIDTPDGQFSLSFKNYLVKNFDGNNDGDLSQAELDAITSLTVPVAQISSVKGINKLTNLKTLNLAGSFLEKGKLTDLDVSGCAFLTDIDCSNNVLETINVQGCSALKSLNCSKNNIAMLDVSNCSQLVNLDCGWNQQLFSLNLYRCTALQSLTCFQCDLTSLGLNDCSMLKELQCDNNRLAGLDISNNQQLTYLQCGGNPMSVILVWKGFNEASYPNFHKEPYASYVEVSGGAPVGGVKPAVVSQRGLIMRTTGSVY